MPILESWRWLSSTRFLEIIQTLAGKLDVGAPLIFLKRTPVVDAYDDEIVGRFTGRVFIADIIADDAEATVYESGKLELVTNQIPNLKLGTRLDQTTVNRLDRLRQGGMLPSDEDAMEAFFNRTAENLVWGVRARMNHLCACMWADSVIYNRLGVSLTGTFGMPANLKVTPSLAWSLDGVTPNVNATPIDDILILATQIGPDNYGIRYDRVTMSSKAFRFIVGTTQFANRSALLAGFPTTAAMINQADQPTMQAMLGRLLNMDIELYDAAYWTRTPDGSKYRTRFLPSNLVLLSLKENDGDARMMDFANGVCTESSVAGLTGNAPSGLAGNQRGPLGYWTSRPDLNPPDVTAWAVARGFPRKHVPESTASLTVGVFA